MVDPATTANGNTELTTFIFKTFHQKLDIEITALRDKYNRLSKAHNELAGEHRQLIACVARLEGTPA